MKVQFVKTSVLAVIAVCSAFTVTDICDTLLFFQEGASTTMTSYGADGKITGSTKTKYLNVEKSDGGTAVTAEQENFDKKGKPLTKSTYFIKCKDGNLQFDMRMMIPKQQQEVYADFEMTVDGSDLEIPSKMQVGASLKDANIAIKVSSRGTPMPMMNMSINITNRKVEAFESVTTPAGTFMCYKLSEHFETKTLFSIKGKTISWFNYEVGNVKTESYKENGSFMGKSELTAIVK